MTSSSPFRYCPQCRTELVEGVRGGRPRLECPAEGCGFVHWDNPVPVVAAIVERDGHVILVHSHGAPPTWYGLVAGFLEPEETIEEAVLREVKEELGITAQLGEYLGAEAFAMRNQIIFTYHVLAPEGDIRLGTDELSDYKAVPIEQLRPWPQGTGPALRRWLEASGHHPPTAAFGEHLPEDSR